MITSQDVQLMAAVATAAQNRRIKAERELKIAKDREVAAQVVFNEHLNKYCEQNRM